MDEQSYADRFSREVDGLLNRVGRIDAEPMSPEYRQAVDLVRRLIESDFSNGSRVRQTLRCQLLNRISQAEEDIPRKESMMTTLPFHPTRPLRGTLVTIVGVALLVLLALVLLYPGGPAVAAQGIEDGTKTIILGSYSVAQKVVASATGKPAPADGWNLVLPGAVVGGNGMPGSNPVVRTVTTLKEAQALAVFPIRTPAYLPSDYSLREIKLAPIWTGPAELLLPSNPIVVLFYSKSGAELAIAEQPVGPQAGSDPNVSMGAITGFSTTSTLDQVQIDGHIGVWADNHVLIWQVGTTSYMIAGTKLDLVEATRIAESLK